MPRGTAFVELVNGPEVERKLAGIAERMLVSGPAFGAVMRNMEAEESSLFASFAGKYVKSGALKASLTGPGDGAIRELTAEGFTFGTSVADARYQGTTGQGEHGGPSAVLKLSDRTRELAGKTLLEYILHGGSVL